MRAFAVLLACATCGCLIHAGPAPEPSGHYPPPGPPPPSPAETTGADVLRAKKIRARSVTARVIYAKEVRAADGRVGRIMRDRREEWERGRSDLDIRVPEVRAEVIYAKEITAEWIDAAEIHAKEVKIGR